MADPIEFWVLGSPEQQGSKTGWVNKRTGQVVIAEAGSTAHKKAHKEWRAAVREQAERYLADNPLGAFPLDEPVAVAIEFVLEPGSDKYRTRHATTPDIDKLCRSVLDSLTDAGMIVNDSRVCELHAAKRYSALGPYGAKLVLTPVGHKERLDREALKAAAAAERRRVRS